jgi:ATP-dependent Clp protease ATP-binding subunit ClpC
VRAAVVTVAGVGRTAAGSPPPGSSANTPATERVLELAAQLAGGAPLGSQHLLEALAWIDDGVAARALQGLGVTRASLADAVDGVNLESTTDLTPELTAAAGLRLTVHGDTAVLTSTDPAVVALVRQLVDELGGELSGDAPLAGYFLPLHRALVGTAAAVHQAVNPPADGPGAIAGEVLLERLKRRQAG